MKERCCCWPSQREIFQLGQSGPKVVTYRPARDSKRAWSTASRILEAAPPVKRPWRGSELDADLTVGRERRLRTAQPREKEHTGVGPNDPQVPAILSSS
jgi:hypothetical protein